ncbi:MAG: hypothetical protein LBI65_04005 [Candidatus Symbiothrix sp.]|jgi:hypothetical protein|nr:hypothetical protein [Candidatus Symbiothrix sp.]
MKVVNKSLFPVLETAVKESLKNYESSNEGRSLSDLYLYHDKEEEKLSFYDDLENLLNEIQLQKSNSLNSATLRVLFQRLEQERFFEKDYIVKPFTVSLVDEGFLILEELIFVDDDTLKLEKNIWANLDKELDDFLKNLME